MSANIQYEPLIANFRRLLQQDYSEKFNLLINFHCKNNKSKDLKLNKLQIQTTINKARVISRKINEIYQIDPTISEYIVQLPIINENDYENEKEEYKDAIESLIKSIDEKMTITLKQFKVIQLLQILLDEKGNEINEEIKHKYNMMSLNESLSFLCTDLHDKSIEYLSSHLIELIDSGSMKYLEEDIKKEIIEKYFFELNQSEKCKEKGRERRRLGQDKKEEILEIFNKMKKEEETEKIIFYFILHLEFDEYNDDILDFIYNKVEDDLIENEISLVIYNIRKHILKHLVQEKSEAACSKKNVIPCEYSRKELSGIINYLKEDDVKLTGGGEINSSYPISNLIRYDSDHINDRYYSGNPNRPTEKDSWIKFDFGVRKINVSSYTIRSNECITNSHAHPKTWTILGSNDDEHWEVINQQTNSPILNGKYKQHRFECEKSDKFYRYIQYKQDDSWDSDKRFQYVIYLSCIEFFGSILQNN